MCYVLLQMHILGQHKDTETLWEHGRHFISLNTVPYSNVTKRPPASDCCLLNIQIIWNHIDCIDRLINGQQNSYIISGVLKSVGTQPGTVCPKETRKGSEWHHEHERVLHSLTHSHSSGISDWGRARKIALFLSRRFCSLSLFLLTLTTDCEGHLGRCKAVIQAG